MYNDRLSIEEARERIAQRVQEAETYGLHQRIGGSDSSVARWIFALAVIIAIVTVGLMI